MRKLIWCAAVFTVMTASPARAYDNSPWCVKANLGAGVVQDICHFSTFDACNRERLAWGNTAFCIQNSRFLPYWNGQPRRPVPHRGRHRRH